jgi:prepilin-type processing-associated H-X9-DG protein
MYTFSRQFEGKYPRPGLVNRLPTAAGDEPGRGPEDHSLNTTANLYSCLIAQNFITPQIVISPAEANPVVVAKNDYNLDAYDPANDVYWDESFAADLEAGSNTSYAHLPLTGKRGRDWWTDTLDADRALLGTRGPKDGLDDPDSYTYQFFGRGKSWAGNICFADGHAEYLESFTFTTSSGALSDNIFSDADGFNFLTFTKEVTADGLGIVPQWD